MNDEIEFQPGDVVSKGTTALLVVGIRGEGYLCLSFSFTAGGNFRGVTQYCYPADALRLADTSAKRSVHEKALLATRQKRNLLPRTVHDKIVATLEKEGRGR